MFLDGIHLVIVLIYRCSPTFGFSLEITGPAESRLENGVGSEAEVGIIMGSDSDLSTMRAAAKTLQSLGVKCEVTIVSAHRTPERMMSYARSAHTRGLKVKALLDIPPADLLTCLYLQGGDQMPSTRDNYSSMLIAYSSRSVKDQKLHWLGV